MKTDTRKIRRCLIARESDAPIEVEVRRSVDFFGHTIVIHRPLNTVDPRSWSASEWSTGTRMGSGRTMAEALEDATFRVALHGGPAAFLARVKELPQINHLDANGD